jgi:NAD(P)-dependent dehydrogenase (short-subunit alcohol dehydrogenase family)
MKLSAAAVVTGVSTGIGYATAQTLAEKGFHVFGSVRRIEDADLLKAEGGI